MPNQWVLVEMVQGVEKDSDFAYLQETLVLIVRLKAGEKKRQDSLVPQSFTRFADQITISTTLQPCMSIPTFQ